MGFVKFKYLTYRNCKVFFKDKAMFITSLISPLILLVLYITFLGGIYKDSYAEFANGSSKIVNGLVGGQLLSSIIAVSTVTVAVSCSLTSVTDKISGARTDLLMAPVSDKVVGLAYFCSSLICSLLVNFVAASVGLIYIAIAGWYLSFADLVLIVVYTFLLSCFGTALASILNLYLSSQGQVTAVSIIVSAAYGFICGAYMPISQYGTTIQNILMFLPSTYGTAIIRDVSIRGVLEELKNTGAPQSAIDQMRSAQSASLEFFGHSVPDYVTILVFVLFTVLLIGVFLILNSISYKTKRKK